MRTYIGNVVLLIILTNCQKMGRIRNRIYKVRIRIRESGSVKNPSGFGTLVPALTNPGPVYSGNHTEYRYAGPHTIWVPPTPILSSRFNVTRFKFYKNQAPIPMDLGIRSIHLKLLRLWTQISILLQTISFVHTGAGKELPLGNIRSLIS
jgi:hypothetical protein